MNGRGFFAELKRRNVYKVAVAYAAVSWLLIQIATQVFPFFEIPNWAVRLVIITLLLGLVPALIFSWTFEMTADGLKRESEEPPARLPSRGRKIGLVTGIAAMIAAALSAWQLSHRHVANAPRAVGPVAVKSIAVLPFANLSDDKANAYFAEGVQDEILTRLSKVADLKVISRTSTQKYKSAPENLRDIARELGVAHVVEGSVQRSGDQVRVSVQLINALTDAHLWADIYDRKLTDIFTVESEVAQTIAETLKARLTGTEKQLIATRATSNMDAYELYLEGKSHWQRRSGDNLPRAIELYQRAIERDQNYALAYAGLARAYILLPAYTTAASQLDSRSKAREAAERALQIDPHLPEAHIALGKILNDDIDLQASVAELERAIQLNPNDASAHHWLGSGPLAGLLRIGEAIAETKRAIELDPLSPVMMVDHGANLSYAKRYDEAIATLRKALELDPQFAYAHEQLGVAYQAKGDLPNAIAAYEKAQALDPFPVTIAQCAAARTLAGDKTAAQAGLSRLDEVAKTREVVSYARALLFASLGEKTKALEMLERGYAERDGPNISFLGLDPLFTSFRGDPRFDALVDKIAGRKPRG